MSANRTAVIAILMCSGLFASGCMFKELARQQEESLQFVRIKGTVSLAAPASGPRVVVLVRMTSDDDGEVIDHYSRRQDGSYYFVVSEPGTYGVGAFFDRNADLTYDPGEPGLALNEKNTFELARGETREGVDLVIEPDGRIPVDGPADIAEMTARSVNEQLGVSIGQLTTVGAIFELGDERFGAASGKMGMWRPLDFIAEIRPGIFFLEPYDPSRIPVLFIHGMTGHPNELGFLAEGLDDSLFQPWFYFYPSGGSLDRIVSHLQQVVIRLYALHGFRRLFVVAHSMGGLVGRGLVLEHEDATHERLIPVFVSISAPWGGQDSAQQGVDRAPTVVDSWRDMAPDSVLQRKLLYQDPETRLHPRPLPEHVSHHLIFGFKRDSNSLGFSSDNVISLASQLFPVAQEMADELYGVDATHGGILSDPVAAKKLNSILTKHAD